MSVRAVRVMTHRRPAEVAGALDALRACAREAGAVLHFDAEETAKHAPQAGEEVALDSALGGDADLCAALGGDGTILRALRAYAGTGIAVFAVNFGYIGFLATIEPDGAEAGFARALAGDFETMTLPAIRAAGEAGGDGVAINDVSIHRKAGLRVAHLSYAAGGNDIGSVRCDGLVVATPAGSTGYNLANGGPVMAWGVEGYAVSFIAPHSLTARALVVAPDDALAITNRSPEEPVDVVIDGRPVGELGPGAAVELLFEEGASVLAQLPGSSFYQRLGEKFGRLAS